jgi:hypothetical protein
MREVRVSLLVDLAAAAFQQPDAFEIFDDVWRLHGVDHQADIASSALEPAVHGVEPDTNSKELRR